MAGIVYIQRGDSWNDGGAWTSVYYYCRGFTDISPYGMFLLTEEGRPGSRWLSNDENSAEGIARHYGAELISGWRPPVITDDGELLSIGKVLVKKVLSGQRLSAKERAANKQLIELRDLAFAKVEDDYGL